MTVRTHQVRLAIVLTLGAASITLAGCSPLGGAITTSTGAPTGNETSHDVFSIKVGDCLNDASRSSNGEVSTVPTIDCGQPHDSEAYFSGTLADGPYPGDAGIAHGAEGICGPAFTSFIGAPFQKGSGPDYSYYTPTENSWSSGDRAVLCVAFDPVGRTTGTLKGSKG